MTVEALKERNARVEADKAWEISWTRRLIITAGIYIIAAIYFAFLGVQGAPFHALVPSGGYFLSTLGLPFFKKIWLQKIYRP